VDITSVIADLRSQRDDIAQAILALEHLSVSQLKRRGRPRKSRLAKAATTQDGPHFAMSPGIASDMEQAFDAHWQDGYLGMLPKLSR
jgi:hypothetical protein